jgi:hypothetical protein
MLRSSAALSVALRAEKFPNQGRHGRGMFLEQEMPAVEQVDATNRCCALALHTS